jgi:hypothetical protein
LAEIFQQVWAAVVVENPYTEEVLNSKERIRTFSASVLSDELVWHRDKNTRLVEVLAGDGWMLQMDNCLPVEMSVGDVYEIPARTYHRIKRGTTDLRIRIIEQWTQLPEDS